MSLDPLYDEVLSWFLVKPFKGRLKASIPFTPELFEAQGLPSSCYLCGGRKWWSLKEGSQRVCGTCHPGRPGAIQWDT